MNRQPIVLRPRVTPDPEAADVLERKLRSLAYYPTNGFHRDQQQRKLLPVQPIPRIPGLLRQQAD